jgi:hypothetical protein
MAQPRFVYYDDSDETIVHYSEVSPSGKLCDGFYALRPSKLLENLCVFVDNKEVKNWLETVLKFFTDVNSVRLSIIFLNSFNIVRVRFGGYIFKPGQQSWAIRVINECNYDVGFGIETWNDGDKSSIILLYYPKRGHIVCNEEAIPCEKHSGLTTIILYENELRVFVAGIPVYRACGIRSNVCLNATFLEARSELKFSCEPNKYPPEQNPMNASHKLITLNADGTHSHSPIASAPSESQLDCKSLASARS